MGNQTIKIKIDPNETMRCPGVCVHCTCPATESMVLEKKEGRTIRQVDVPLCDKCAPQLRRQSAAEERLQKLSRLLSIVAGVATALTVFLLMAGFAIWLRLPGALLLGLVAAVFVTWLFRPVIAKAALPEKKEILEAAQLEAFSWRTATFVFSNEEFVERFAELNESLLVET